MLGGDLSPFFQPGHFSQTVVWKGVAGQGILDEPTDIVHGGDVITTDYALQVPAAQFGAAKYGDAIKVGGVSYTIRANKPIDDGAICVLVLTKV